MTSNVDGLKRRSAGRSLLPEIRQNLAELFEVPPEALNFLSLEESDDVRERASQSFPPRNRLESSRGDYPFLSRTIKAALTPTSLLPESGGEIFLILPEADRVGVLRVATSWINRKWRELLRAKEDGFVLVDRSFSNKAVLQAEGDEVGRDVLDLATWGAEWTDALRKFP
jgi:hypothetical protein